MGHNEQLEKIQNLEQFRLPPDFRGRSAITVQIWWLVQATLFRWSPQFMYGWRSFLLRLFGARIGRKVLIRPTVTITYPWKLSIGNHCWIGDDVTLYTLGELEIGSNTVISQKSYICTAGHHFNSLNFDIFNKKVIIAEKVWVATDVFVAPGVSIGAGCVVGARSSVFADLPALMVCKGTPARPVRPRQ